MKETPAMKNLFATAAAACLVLGSGSVLGVEKGQPLAPSSPAVAYACVSVPKSGQVAVIDTPPPAGFKCPQGQKLVVISKDHADALAAAKPTDTLEPTPANQLPGVPPPPRAKKWTRCKQLAPDLWYCCTGSYHNCYLY
jgi:hypothetical protein